MLQAAKHPVVVIMLTATPLDLTNAIEDPKVGAILHVGQPGVQTLGIGDLVFGLAVPAGRTVQTVYPKEYADQISIFDFNMRPGPSIWPRPDCRVPAPQCPRGVNPGRTHRFYTGKPVVPFGWGLSYTTFSYAIESAPQNLSLAPLKNLLDSRKKHVKGAGLSLTTLDSVDPAVRYAVRVTNTGRRDADDVVLGFVRPPGAGVDGVPLQNLFGFERVHVKAGESVLVHLNLSLGEFAGTTTSGEQEPLPGRYKVMFGVKETLAHQMGYVETTLLATSL